MNQSMKFGGIAAATMMRRRDVEQALSALGGIIIGEHWRPHHKSGTMKKIADLYGHNDITNEGKNHILDVEFNGTTPVTTWYAGLVNASGFSAFAAADVMNSHAGWTEFTTYSQGARVTWGSGAASGQSITNASAMVFDITGTGTVHGLFITSVNTKGGTTGKLWATAAYSGDVSVLNGDQIRSTYTLSA